MGWKTIYSVKARKSFRPEREMQGNMEEQVTREDILIEALPYIRNFYGSTIVIKVGGNALVEPDIMDAIARDVVLLHYVGIHPVVVHGGGQEITQKMRQLGKEPEFIAGLRVTDAETLEITRMVLVGNINQRIVSMICKHGGKAVSLSGNDGMLITARKQVPQKVMVEGVEHQVDLGFVGETEVVNNEILKTITDKGFIPVISPIAVDVNGEHLNLNADTVASDMAASLGAKKLILLTDVKGVMEDPSDPGTTIHRLTLAEAEQLMDTDTIKTGMQPKMKACINALHAGVEKAHIIDGRRKHALLLELFTDYGIGTMIEREKSEI